MDSGVAWSGVELGKCYETKEEVARDTCKSNGIAALKFSIQ